MAMRRTVGEFRGDARGRERTGGQDDPAQTAQKKLGQRGKLALRLLFPNSLPRGEDGLFLTLSSPFMSPMRGERGHETVLGAPPYFVLFKQAIIMTPISNFLSINPNVNFM